jgi:hypothetical protein
MDPYEPHVDNWETILTRDVIEHHKFGPNGSLICCVELFSSNDNEWFAEAIGDHESDYLLIGLPGQIELHSHMTVLTSFNDCRSRATTSSSSSALTRGSWLTQASSSAAPGGAVDDDGA